MNKGFTLVELLAVISVLAIIALITTPTIINSINDSKKKSYKASVDTIEKASEDYMALPSNSVLLNSYIIKNGGLRIYVSELKCNGLIDDKTYATSNCDNINSLSKKYHESNTNGDDLTNYENASKGNQNYLSNPCKKNPINGYVLVQKTSSKITYTYKSFDQNKECPI